MLNMDEYNKVFGNNIIHREFNMKDICSFDFGENIGFEFKRQMTVGVRIDECETVHFIKVKYVEFSDDNFGGNLILYKNERNDGHIYKVGIIDLYHLKNNNGTVEFY